MKKITRTLFLSRIKSLKCEKRLSTVANLKTNDDFIIKSPFKDVVIPNMRIVDRLWINSENFQNHVAVECQVTKKNYNYRQLHKNINIFATSLHKKFGLKPDDVVSVMLPNCPEYIVIALGTLHAGCVMTTFNPIYKEYEISHQMQITQPKVTITCPECYNTVVKGLNAAQNNSKIIIVDKPDTVMPSGTIRYSEIAESGEADYSMLDKIERTVDDLAFILFSSGTTGLPKGVNLTFGNLLSGIQMMHDENICYAEMADGDFQEVLPCILPFFHVYGLMITVLGHLAKGCKLVTIGKFSPKLYLDVLIDHKCTLLYVVPPIAILLDKHPDVTEEHFKHIKRIVCGAAPLSATDTEGILKKSKGKLQFGQGYGATETTSLGTTTPKYAVVKDYSASGFPVPSVELKFCDPISGTPVPIGEVGELYLKGPNVTKGYYKNEAATKDTFTEDGFFKTGDLGYFKPGVGMFITDRIKELIKVKGMQVAPAELEGLLRTHPYVQDAAVIGVPHQLYGEVPKAVIIPKKDAKASAEEIQSYVANKVASFKKIEEVVFVDDIPKTSSGKILRRELKKMYS